MKNKKTDKQEQTLQKLLFNKDFLDKVYRIRIEYAIPKDHGFSTDENVRKWNRGVIACFANKSKGIMLSEASDALMRDFGLPALYRIPLINFIFFDVLPVPNSPLILQLKWDEKTKQLECMIQIFGDTTLKDIKDSWRNITEIQRGIDITL